MDKRPSCRGFAKMVTFLCPHVFWHEDILFLGGDIHAQRKGFRDQEIHR